MKEDVTQQKAALQEVTLKADHEHGGIQYKTGDKIKVRPDQAQWLKEMGKV